MKISQSLRNQLVKAQKNEITEYFIYKELAKRGKTENRKTLEQIAEEELGHYHFWRNLTKEEVKADAFKISLYSLIVRFLGLNFSVRLMEQGEDFAQANYQKIRQFNPQVEKIIQEERKHEQIILDLLDKEELAYTGSIVLGLNDALVELTGALAGLTLALQQAKVVAIAGLITGVAASLSMAASEYLSTKEEQDSKKDPVKASLITGLTYLMVVFFLVTPYFLLPNLFVSLGLALVVSLIMISFFNFYIAVAKNLSFKKKFWEMAGISLGVAGLNFLIGLLMRKYLKIEI